MLKRKKKRLEGRLEDCRTCGSTGGSYTSVCQRCKGCGVVWVYTATEIARLRALKVMQDGEGPRLRALRP